MNDGKLWERDFWSTSEFLKEIFIFLWKGRKKGARSKIRPFTARIIFFAISPLFLSPSSSLSMHWFSFFPSFFLLVHGSTNACVAFPVRGARLNWSESSFAPLATLLARWANWRRIGSSVVLSLFHNNSLLKITLFWLNDSIAVSIYMFSQNLATLPLFPVSFPSLPKWK